MFYILIIIFFAHSESSEAAVIIGHNSQSCRALHKNGAECICHPQNSVQLCAHMHVKYFREEKKERREKLLFSIFLQPRTSIQKRVPNRHIFFVCSIFIYLIFFFRAHLQKIYGALFFFFQIRHHHVSHPIKTVSFL